MPPRARLACPNCGSLESDVRESRGSDEGIIRRRHCGDCGESYSSLEIVIASTLRSGPKIELIMPIGRAIAKLKEMTLELEKIHNAAVPPARRIG